MSGIGKIIGKIFNACVRKQNFAKAVGKKLTKAPTIKVGLFGRNVPRPEPMKVGGILKPRKERFENAVDLLGKRNPNDFVSVDEVAREMQRLELERRAVTTLPVYKRSNKSISLLQQIDSDIQKGKELLEIMD